MAWCLLLLRPWHPCVELASAQPGQQMPTAGGLYWHRDPLKAQGRTRGTIRELELRRPGDRLRRGVLRPVCPAPLPQPFIASRRGLEHVWKLALGLGPAAPPR